jgi:hypothetical protein
VVDDADDIILLLRRERYALWNIMPFCQTAPTTGGGGMLGDKYRVTAHGRLFTVVGGLRGRKALFDKIRGMLVNGFGAFVPAVLPFLIA